MVVFISEQNILRNIQRESGRSSKSLYKINRKIHFRRNFPSFLIFQKERTQNGNNELRQSIIDKHHDNGNISQ